MSKDLTQVKDPAVFSLPALTVASSATTPATTSSVATATTAPNSSVQTSDNSDTDSGSTEDSSGNIEYVPTFSTSVSSFSLMGGSALGLASLAILKQNQSLFEIAMQSLDASVDASAVATSYAQQEWSTSYTAAQESYAAGMAQVGQEWTSAAIGAASVGVTIGAMTLQNQFGAMNKAQTDEAMGKSLLKEMDADHTAVDLKDPEIQTAAVGGAGATVSRGPLTEKDLRADLKKNGGDLNTDIRNKYNGHVDNEKQLEIATEISFRKDMEKSGGMITDDMKAKYSITEQGTREGSNDEFPAFTKYKAIKNGSSTDTEANDIYMYNTKREKVEAIKEDLRANGVISDGTIQKHGTSEKGWIWGSKKKIDASTDNEVKLAIKELKGEETPDSFSKIKKKQEEFITHSQHQYTAAQQGINTMVSLVREIGSSIDSGAKALWGSVQTRRSKIASYLNADAKLLGTTSGQMFGSKDTWNSNNLKFFDQAMSVSSTDALRRANAVA